MGLFDSLFGPKEVSNLTHGIMVGTTVEVRLGKSHTYGVVTKNNIRRQLYDIRITQKGHPEKGKTIRNIRWNLVTPHRKKVPDYKAVDIDKRDRSDIQHRRFIGSVQAAHGIDPKTGRMMSSRQYKRWLAANPGANRRIHGTFIEPDE